MIDTARLITLLTLISDIYALLDDLYHGRGAPNQIAAQLNQAAKGIHSWNMAHSRANAPKPQAR